MQYLLKFVEGSTTNIQLNLIIHVRSDSDPCLLFIYSLGFFLPVFKSDVLAAAYWFVTNQIRNYIQ